MYMRKSIFFAALMLYAATVSAQRFMPVVKRSAATDDIITTLPSTAKDSLYLEDTYIMSGVRLQHYTWSGHFHHLAFLKVCLSHKSSVLLLPCKDKTDISTATVLSVQESSL